MDDNVANVPVVDALAELRLDRFRLKVAPLTEPTQHRVIRPHIPEVFQWGARDEAVDHPLLVDDAVILKLHRARVAEDHLASGGGGWHFEDNLAVIGIALFSADGVIVSVIDRRGIEAVRRRTAGRRAPAAAMPRRSRRCAPRPCRRKIGVHVLPAQISAAIMKIGASRQGIRNMPLVSSWSRR